MNNFLSELKVICSQNKILFFSLLLLSILVGFKPEAVSELVAFLLSIVVMLALSLNLIAITRNYIIEKFKGVQGVEFNDYKTVTLQSLKIFLKYFLILILFYIIVTFVMVIAVVALSETATDIELMIDKIVDSPIFYFIVVFLSLLILFKLLFVPNILTFKQESYKAKIIVNKSYEVIKRKFMFFVLTYFGIQLLLLLYFRENAIEGKLTYATVAGIIYCWLFLVYQVKFIEIVRENRDIEMLYHNAMEEV